MQADRHSMTAVIMAVLRSYHASGPRPCIFEDNLAHALVSPAECEAFERASLGLLESVDPALAASCTDREMSIQHATRSAWARVLAHSPARGMSKIHYSRPSRTVRTST